MGFFKDFKEDFSQAVNELIPDDNDNSIDTSDQMVNTLDADETTSDDAEIVMKEWLEDFDPDNTDDKSEENTNLEDDYTEDINSPDDEIIVDNYIENEDTEKIEKEIMERNKEDMEENIDLELLDALNAEDETEEKVNESENKVRAASITDDDEEVTIISKGTTITGNISSDGSLEIMGNVTGDIECLGKLSITGKIKGNTTAAEVYVNTERLEGSINSEGTVKIGLGTVVVGDIIGTSAVVAGAVKGEIDINGPVVIDSTAIIKGNIKAKSLQINNGAVIDGFCSLSYSDIDVENVFE